MPMKPVNGCVVLTNSTHCINPRKRRYLPWTHCTNLLIPRPSSELKASGSEIWYRELYFDLI